MDPTSLKLSTLVRPRRRSAKLVVATRFLISNLVELEAISLILEIAFQSNVSEHLREWLELLLRHLILSCWLLSYSR